MPYLPPQMQQVVFQLLDCEITDCDYSFDNAVISAEKVTYVR